MKGYRTFLVAFLTIVSGVLAQTNWFEVFHDPQAGAIAIIMGIVMVVLRVITTTPIFRSVPAEEKKEIK